MVTQFGVESPRAPGRPDITTSEPTNSTEPTGGVTERATSDRDDRLVAPGPVLGELGIEMPDDFRARMEACGWSLDQEVVAEAGAALPAELVHRFGIAGTPDSCRARLERLLEAFPQISQVAIVPFAPRGGAVLATLRRFIDEVALEPVAWS